MCGLAVTHRPQASGIHSSIRAASLRVELSLLPGSVPAILFTDRLQADCRALSEVDVDAELRHVGPVREARDLDAGVAEVTNRVWVEHRRGLLQFGVYHEVTDAVAAKTAGATAWHGKLAAKPAALVQLLEGPLIRAVANEVECGHVLAEAVESTQRLAALATRHTASSLTARIGEGPLGWAEVGLYSKYMQV